VTADGKAPLWKIHNERVVDDTRRIIGAASLVGLLHVLAF